MRQFYALFWTVSPIINVIQICKDMSRVSSSHWLSREDARACKLVFVICGIATAIISQRCVYLRMPFCDYICPLCSAVPCVQPSLVFSRPLCSAVPCVQPSLVPVSRWFFCGTFKNSEMNALPQVISFALLLFRPGECQLPISCQTADPNQLCCIYNGQQCNGMLKRGRPRCVCVCVLGPVRYLY